MATIEREPPAQRLRASAQVGSDVSGYPPQLQEPRYATLDAWRGAACLLIVLFHATFYASAGLTLKTVNPLSWIVYACRQASLGVPVFFVISGYCISATVDAGRRKGDKLTAFFARRLRRIFPPYLACLLASALLFAGVETIRPGLFDDLVHPITRPWTLSAGQLFGNVTLTEVWRCNLGVGGPRLLFLGHSWSLGYEEQFYAIAGILLLCAPRRFFAGAAAITLAVLVTMRFAPYGFFFDGKWVLFAAGVLVYHATVYGNARSQRMAAYLLLAGVAIPFMPPFRGMGEKIWWVSALLSAAAMIAMRRYDAGLAELRLTRLLRFCGKRCYSIYLIHWPIVKLISHVLWLSGLRSLAGTVYVLLPLCLAASLASGELFFRCIERRFINPCRT